LNKLLLATAFTAALAATPAAAWPQKFTLNNNTSFNKLVVEMVSLTVPGGGSTATFKLGEVWPGQSAGFDFFKDPPCLRWVTITQKFGPPITASNQMNICTQTTITITGPTSALTYTFTYNN
jgi:hypothetical protein